MRRPSHEDLIALPFAAVGLAIGIGRVVIKPFLMEATDKITHQSQANITHIGRPANPDTPEDIAA